MGKDGMKSHIYTEQEAKSLCSDLWDMIEYLAGQGKYVNPHLTEDVKETVFDVSTMKIILLRERGYVDLMFDCPLCEWYRTKRGSVEDVQKNGCFDCPLENCIANGYSDFMTYEAIQSFVEFIHERLGDA